MYNDVFNLYNCVKSFSSKEVEYIASLNLGNKFATSVLSVRCLCINTACGVRSKPAFLKKMLQIIKVTKFVVLNIPYY